MIIWGSAEQRFPFGDVLFQTGDSHLKYTGKELDEGYGFDLYYYGARYYNSGWGRFISPDPVREYYNPYSYVKNNPIKYYDPDGRHIPWREILAVIMTIDWILEKTTGEGIEYWAGEFYENYENSDPALSGDQQGYYW